MHRIPDHGFMHTRRQVLFAGGALMVSVTLAPFARAQSGAVKVEGGKKPTFLPPPDSRDPVAHSLAEQLFWNDIMMEHGLFLTMLMPGPDLADENARAEGFRKTFEQRFAAVKGAAFNEQTFVGENEKTIAHMEEFIAYKRDLGKRQDDGKLHSLVWPTFFDHTAREAEHGVARLRRLSNGDTTVDRSEADKYWAAIMGEHADFIAHLLDPAERALIGTSEKAAEEFYELVAKPDHDKVQKATASLHDFKVVAGKGIDSGAINSIIHPVLADHVRREAIKASDELKRATTS